MFAKIKSKIYGLIIRTQKYTGTDNIYIFQSGSWLIAAQIGSMAISMCMAILWAHLVPKEVYGQYNFVLSIASFFAIFSLGGMSTSLIQAVARGLEGTIRPMMRVMFKWSTLAVLTGFIVAVYYWWQGNQTLAICFLIAGAFSPLFNNFPLFNDYLAGKKIFDLQAKYSLARSFIAAAVTAAVLFLTNNVIYLVLVYFASNSLAYGFFYFLSLKKVPPKGGIDDEAIRYGKHLTVVGVLSRIAAYIDRILVFHYLGAVDLAVYSFAALLPEQINGLAKTIGVLALPKLATSQEKEIKKTLVKRTFIIGLSVGAAVLIYVLTADLIFKIFFPAYLSSALYSKIYALSLLGSISLIPGTAFFAKAKTKIIYQYNISSDLIKIAVFFVSVRYFGLMGIVVAAIIYRFATAALSFFLFRNI